MRRMLPLARRYVGETVLNDVRVVAVDQSIAQGAVAAATTPPAVLRTP